MISASHAPYDPPFERIFSNIRVVKARNGPVVRPTDAESGAEAEEAAWRMRADLRADPFVLAYHAAVANGNDVDQPRDLAKSITLKMWQTIRTDSSVSEEKTVWS